MLKTLYRFVADVIQKFIPGSDYDKVLKSLEGKWVRIWSNGGHVHYVGRLVIKKDCVVLYYSNNTVVIFRHRNIGSVVQLDPEEVVALNSELVEEMVEKAFEDSTLRSN